MSSFQNNTKTSINLTVNNTCQMSSFQGNTKTFTAEYEPFNRLLIEMQKERPFKYAESFADLKKELENGNCIHADFHRGKNFIKLVEDMNEFFKTGKSWFAELGYSENSYCLKKTYHPTILFALQRFASLMDYNTESDDNYLIITWN